MTDCGRMEVLLEAYVAGSAAESDSAVVLAHCRTCAPCRRLIELHRELLRLGSEAVGPAGADLDRLTASVLAEVSGSRTAPASRSMRRPPTAGRSLAVAIAAGTLLFAAGLAAGRYSFGTNPSNGNGSMTPRLVSAMGAEAASNLDLSDVEDSRFIYSNVSFRNLDEDRIALDFDVTTHVRLVEPAESELAREILVHAILDRSSTGSRLRALGYAGGAPEPKVRQALILAFRRDPSLAIRLKALEVLSDHLDQPGVEEAVIDALREDTAVQLRLLALDCLATHRVSSDRIRDVIQGGGQRGDEALLVRLAEYEKRL